jgi:hypothetical protein
MHKAGNSLQSSASRAAIDGRVVEPLAQNGLLLLAVVPPISRANQYVVEEVSISKSSSAVDTARAHL